MRSTRIYRLLPESLLWLFTIACNTPSPISIDVPASVPPTPNVSSTPVFRQDVYPSPTAIQLPFNSKVENNEFCKSPSANLAVSENNDISEDEIVYQLIKIWLRRYSNPSAPLFCRIDGYTIENIYYDLSILSGPLEPRGDFMRVADFSVKLIQIPSDWMSFSGELDQENWLHLSQPVAVFKTNEGYTMQFAHP
jgi:hypothetical protein